MSSDDVGALHTALDAYDQGRLGDAQPTLARLAGKYPSNYEANEALGSLYAETSRFQQALPFLERSCTLAPGQAIAHANLGATYLQLSRPADAVRELRKATALDPSNGPAQANLGRALMLSRQPELAARAFRTALDASPADPELRYDLALALYGSGSPAEAASTLEPIPAPARTEQMESLAGDAEERAGHFQQALGHYQAAARLNPSDANLYAVTAELLRHWNWPEAIEMANFGTARFPASTHFRMAAGIAQYGKSDYPAAIQTFSALLAADPDNAAVADLLGRSCSALTDGDNSGCGGIESFAERHPGNAVMNTYAAVAILHTPGAKGNLDRAARLLETAISADPKYAPAHLQLGIVEQTRQRWPESAAHLEHAIALNPTSAEAHYRLSRAYAHMGRQKDAQTEIALYQTGSKEAKDALDRRLQEVMRFVLSPS